MKYKVTVMVPFEFEIQSKYSSDSDEIESYISKNKETIADKIEDDFDRYKFKESIIRQLTLNNAIILPMVEDNKTILFMD